MTKGASLPANGTLLIRFDTHTSASLLLGQDPPLKYVRFVASLGELSRAAMIRLSVRSYCVCARLPNARCKIIPCPRVRLAVPVHDEAAILDGFLVRYAVRIV